jgi:hypothetical protein
VSLRLLLNEEDVAAVADVIPQEVREAPRPADSVAAIPQEGRTVAPFLWFSG